MRKFIVLVLSLVIVGKASAETFTFKFTKGEKFRLVTTTVEKVYLDDEFSHNVQFLTKIACEVKDVKDGAAVLASLSQVSGRRDKDIWSYTMEEEYTSVFSLSPRGKHTVDRRYLYPMTRDMPLFPEGDLKPGAVWTAPGEEVHDLYTHYGIQTPFRIPVTVQYQFTGVQTVDGRRLSQIDLNYSYLTKVKGVGQIKGAFYPIMISGTCRRSCFWDLAAGRLAFYREEFDVFYNLSNGSVVEFVGTHRGDTILAKPLDAAETARDISREIEKEKLEDVRVEAAEEGVKITLDKIQFQPDSDLITPGELRKIEVIASILKKYPGRDIKLVGHTAAVGTPESCLDLSIRRAKAVGDELLSLRARRADEMTIQGKGLTEPVAPNDTEAGRIKNRRVEIFILEN